MKSREHKKLNTPVTIIGASAAGLACGARLKRAGIDFIMVEREDRVTHAWRRHYDRLHLHTPKRFSHLPFKKFDASLPTYVAKDDLVKYLEDYVKEFGLKPILNTEVKEVKRTDNRWTIISDELEITSQKVIICTGKTNKPKMIQKPGMDSFPGTIKHSATYKNGSDYKGKKVLVVGFGNSACEIAICLAEHGAHPYLSVRSMVNVIPRDVAGIPILQLSRIQAKLPPKIADMVSAPLRKVVIGDISRYGLRQAPYGPMQQVAEEQRTPLIDIGTLKLIEEGKLKVYGDIQEITGAKVHFTEGSEVIDDIILATGYDDALESFLPATAINRDDLKMPYKKRASKGQNGMYFCGFYLSPLGMLEEICTESGLIVKDIKHSL